MESNIANTEHKDQQSSSSPSADGSTRDEPEDVMNTGRSRQSNQLPDSYTAKSSSETDRTVSHSMSTSSIPTEAARKPSFEHMSDHALDVHVTTHEEDGTQLYNSVVAEKEHKLDKVKTTASDKPYSAWSPTAKVLIVLVATLGGSFSPFTANIYFPAISTISRDLGVSISQVNLTITTYMIFQAIAPSFISAIADERGRRPGYVIGFTIYIAANLGLGLNNSYAGLLVLRCLQSCGSSGLVSLMYGTITDVVTSAERGKYISITSLASILAPSVAPIVGGLLAGHLGWRSIFWFLLIMSGVYFVPLVLFFPETCRNIVGDGSIPPQKWNKCLLNIVDKSKDDTLEEGAELGKTSSKVKNQKTWRAINPLRTLKVVADPETGMILLYIGLIYGGFYAITTSVTVQFEVIYHLDTTFQGLLFLTQAVGSIFAAIVNTKLIDHNYRRIATQAGVPVDKKRQVDMLLMPIERARLQISIPVFAAAGIFIIIYGWLLQLHVHIAGPIVMMVFNSFCIMIAFNSCNVLVQDLHRKRGSTASAANNLVRCLMGAGATAIVNPIIDAIGNGWTFTIVGLIYIVMLPLLWVPFKYGHAMRKKKAERQMQKK